MPETATPESPEVARRRRTARLAVAAAIILGLPLAVLAYRLGVPGLSSLFKESPIRSFVVVTPEGEASHARALPMPAGGPGVKRDDAAEDSTRLIAREAALKPAPAPARPPPAPPTPKPAPATQEPPKITMVQAPPPIPAEPARPRWPHLRVMTFKQREAQQQPTMFLMNVGPPNGQTVPAAPAQAKPVQVAAPAQPSQPASATKVPVSAPVTIPAPTPRKKKVEPIPLVPRPRTGGRQLGQAAVSAQTTVGGADPARFQDAPPGPAFPAASGAAAAFEPGHTTLIGAPDLPPKPNPLTTGAAPRKDNRQPGQAPDPTNP